MGAREVRVRARVNVQENNARISSLWQCVNICARAFVRASDPLCTRDREEVGSEGGRKSATAATGSVWSSALKKQKKTGSFSLISHFAG